MTERGRSGEQVQGTREVGHFGDDEGGDDEGPGVGFEQVETCGAVPVVAVDVRVQRAGVDGSE